MLTVRDLWKAYGEEPVLRGPSVTVGPGELLAVVGPSGAGKSTLLRVIAGLERPDRGEVTLDGRVVASWRDHVPPGERRVGMVFQDLALWPHMTAREHVRFALGGRRLDAAALRRRTDEVLASVRLDALAHRYPAELSGGERQRLAIARAIAARPACVLMDEPFSSLDVLLRTEMLALTAAMRATTSSAIVYVTHDLDEALGLADRVVVLRNGRCAWAGSRAEAARIGRQGVVARFEADDDPAP